VAEAHFAPVRRPPLVPLTLPAQGQPYGPAMHAAFNAPQRPFVPLAAPEEAGVDVAPEQQFADFAVKPGDEPQPLLPKTEEPPARDELEGDGGTASPAQHDGAADEGDDAAAAAASSGAADASPPPDVPSSSSAPESRRPPLQQCSEAQFLADLRAFLSAKRGKQLDAATFPDAVLNGIQLDLWALYREVAVRGGFEGSSIPWKGQVFPRMRNYTPVNNMTGVGNALKRHYQAWLLDYEKAHPDDVVGEVCAGCALGDDNGNDWISCDECSTWMHFNCDERGKTGELGAFEDFDESRPFVCSGCHLSSKRQKTE